MVSGVLKDCAVNKYVRRQPISIRTYHDGSTEAENNHGGRKDYTEEGG